MLSSNHKSNKCCFVLHVLNQAFAYCMSNTNRAFVSGPIIEGGFRGRGQGGFFYCLDVCLLSGYLRATLPNCHTQNHLSGCGAEGPTGAYEKADLRVALAHGWLLHTVIICLSPSLPPPPPLSVSLSSVCKPCCDHCSDRRKRLFVQDPATCRCSCKHTDEYCKERQQELNERTCKYVGEDSHSGTITSKQDS